MTDEQRPAPWTEQVERIAADERLRIPPGYAAPCELCGGALDVRAHGVHQWVAGWVKQRGGGGGHGISCPQRERRYAHGECVNRAARGLSNQGALFG